MAIQTLALNLQLDGTTPEWLLLVPAGNFTGRDGRSWINDQPQAVIAYNRELDRDIVFDFEHSTALKAPKGEEAPASGWIKVAELEIRDGAIWGRVDWNESGKEALSKEQYRYYSPAFLYSSNGRVTGIHHIALTNRHNLFDLPALNHQLPHEENPMKLAAAIAAALGLNAETATETDAVTAIGQLKSKNQELALNSQQPDPAKFIPVETHQLALNRAEEAEGQLAEHRKTERTAKAEALVDGAIEGKKIAPANRDHYLALCSQEGGYEQVEKLLAAAPQVIADDSNLDGKKPEADQVALNHEQQQIDTMFGNSAEDVQKYNS